MKNDDKCVKNYVRCEDDPLTFRGCDAKTFENYVHFGNQKFTKFVLVAVFRVRGGGY